MYSRYLAIYSLADGHCMAQLDSERLVYNVERFGQSVFAVEHHSV
jgi:hypothetical protein